MTDTEKIVGRVASTTGSRITGILNGDAVADGGATEAVRIGDLVKCDTGRSVVFGIVSEARIVDFPGAAGGDRGTAIDIDLFGEAVADGEGGSAFRRGVSIYPLLRQPIVTATSENLAQVYARPSASSVRVGTLHQDPDLAAYILVDELLGKHFSILGMTGSGKSCAAALILRRILEAHPCGHIVLLDPHSEYHGSFGEHSELIDPDSLDLPYWLMNFEEAVAVICSPDGPTRHSEMEILKEAILTAKRAALPGHEDRLWLTVDTPVPYAITALMRFIDGQLGKLDRAETTEPYLRIKAKLERLRGDRRYQFMFAGRSVRDNLAEIVARLFRIPVDGKPITVIDLSGVPSEIVDVCVSILCRLVFDFAVWSERDEAVPVLLACEEAHRYIPRDPTLGFGPTRQAISRIAKEGRKYGVSLCLMTQRPAEISESILSQCNTIFSMRISNQRDQEFVRNAMPDSAGGLLAALPSLLNQEAVVVGEGVSLPMRIRFDDLATEHQPRSATAIFSRAWQEERGDHASIAGVLDRWRRQARE